MARLKIISDELCSFSQKRGGAFHTYHQAHKFTEGVNPVKEFLSARMDEVRIYWALKTSERILRTVGAQDALDFQMRVLEREKGRRISYRKQRDHTCHTLNNYILGFYLLEHSDFLKTHMTEAFSRRNLSLSSFVYLWPYASLLHDVGYLFEGGFRKITDTFKDPAVSNSTNLLNDYFKYNFWKFYGFNEIATDDIINSGIAWRQEIDNSDSIRLANSLSEAGCLSSIVDTCNEEAVAGGPLETLPTNCFSLWENNYRAFGNERMARAIDLLRTDFYSMAENDHPKIKRKILDHGVCSGLILLLFITYFYALHTGLKRRNGTSAWQETTSTQVKGYLSTVEEGVASTKWWWSGLVWATAATALHNKYDELPGLEPLRVDDDPLTYLGILVDELQVWDRFNVFDGVLNRDCDISEIPVQCSEIRLGADKSGPPVRFSVPSREFGKVKKTLNSRLANWEEIVVLHEH